MRYIIPDYYREFVCTADQCEDTCCAGWQIVVDRKSLIRYGAEKSKFRRRLHSSVRWISGTFRQKEGKRCALLNEDNLCDLYTALGKDSLCRTCRTYPRHIEQFEGTREVTLSASCPEAARILLNQKEPVKFLQYEREGMEDKAFEDFDLLLYSKLADCREVMIQILQDRTKDLETRCGLVLGIAHDIQVRIQKENIFSCDEVLEGYQGTRAELFVKKKLERPGLKEERYRYLKKTFQSLHTLELLKEDWEVLLRETEQLLYQEGEAAYEESRQEYRRWLDTCMPEWEIQCEQMLVYFLFTYYCGAVYDGKAYGKAQMAVVSVWIIWEILAAKWLRNEKCLDVEDVTDTLYRYSREVEHSDENLERMEALMERNLVPLLQKK